MDRIRTASPASPYALLGLSPGAPLPDVKRAYRRLAMRFHPDRAGTKDLRAFLEVKCAYEWIVAHPRPAEPGDLRRRSVMRTTPVRRATRDRWTKFRPATPPAAAGSRWPGGQWYWEGIRERASKR